ncbi:hypothetical protein CB1_000350011 [Camelus ferus]|nr:hypothetical protein CB1_000350011 [Camelus ferus]
MNIDPNAINWISSKEHARVERQHGFQMHTPHVLFLTGLLITHAGPARRHEPSSKGTQALVTPKRRLSKKNSRDSEERVTALGTGPRLKRRRRVRETRRSRSSRWAQTRAPGRDLVVAATDLPQRPGRAAEHRLPELTEGRRAGGIGASEVLLQLLWFKGEEGSRVLCGERRSELQDLPGAPQPCRSWAAEQVDSREPSELGEHLYEGTLAYERCCVWVHRGWNAPDLDGRDEPALVRGRRGGGTALDRSGGWGRCDCLLCLKTCRCPEA